MDKTAERVGTDFANQPDVEMELGTSLADAFYSLVLYKEQKRGSGGLERFLASKPIARGFRCNNHSGQ